MQYRPLGNSGISVSEIGFGCMSLGTDHAANERLLHQAFDQGINFFDTADLYDKGANETSVGKALKDRRTKLILATKVGNQWRADGSDWDWNPRKDYIKKAVHDSLRRLQTDYLDLYQLHGGTIDDPIDETIEAFEELVREGHIRHYGISSIRPNTIRNWTDRSKLASVMSQYSLLDRRPEEFILPHLAEKGVGIIVRGAVAKGLLIDKPAKAYLGHSEQDIRQVQLAIQERVSSDLNAAQIALKFALAQPAVSTIAAGIRTEKQLLENVGASRTADLSPELLAHLRAALPPLVYENHR